MFFGIGPPRSYALPPALAPSEEKHSLDVAIAEDPRGRVVARVTAASLTLWTTSVHTAAPRRLLSLKRSAGSSTPSAATATTASASRPQPRVWALWLAHDHLAVLDAGATAVDIYAFEGLPHVATTRILDPEEQEIQRPHADASTSEPSTAVEIHVTGRVVDRVDVAAVDDRACCLGGLAGGAMLFVGLSSGLITVVHIPTAMEPESTALPTIWKIDVRVHLEPTPSAASTSTATATSTATSTACVGLSAATWLRPARGQIVPSWVYLVACFDGGKCFVMLLAPVAKSIEQLLSLVNSQQYDSDPNASSAGAGVGSNGCSGRCTAATLEPRGTRLALGWSDGGVSLFRLGVQRPDPKSSQRLLVLEPLRELSMQYWGYAPRDVGGVSALAWTHDARALAVGFSARGFSVFSTDGCRLLSSLPQHHTGSRAAPDEICASGVTALVWTRSSSSLVVVDRRPPPAVEAATANDVTETPDAARAPVVKELQDLAERVDVPLFKGEDGLCLSLSGTPGRGGAWVRSEHCFTRRRDGGEGPAEASGKICGGDLLVAIDGDDSVALLAFDAVIQRLKAVPQDSTVTLTFLRLRWPVVYPLAVAALASPPFLERNGLTPLFSDDNEPMDEDLCLREYALRMQEQHGDCESDDVDGTGRRPSFLEIERRAKFESWSALQGMPRDVAQHKYLKLLLALFPTWDPTRALEALVELASDLELTAPENSSNANDPNGPTSNDRNDQAAIATAETRASSAARLAFIEYDVARRVALQSHSADRVLLEAAALRLLPAPALDDPCAVVSAPSWQVPAAYAAACAPLRLVALSPTAQHVAVAGQRGLCVFNQRTGKWRLFGNVNDEQDLVVWALAWLGDDVVLVSGTRTSEHHRVLHLVAYPRNHLDAESVLATLSFRLDDDDDADDDNKQDDDELEHDDHVPRGVVTALEVEGDDAAFGLSRRELWWLGVDLAGGLAQQDLALTLTVRRRVRLPASLRQRQRGDAGHVGGRVLDFSLVPRAVHLAQDAQETGSSTTTTTPARRQRALSHSESSGAGWLSSLVTLLVGGEVPDQYEPADVLPRVVLLDAAGDVVVWDPEMRSQRLLSSRVSALVRVVVASTRWPTPCRLLVGLYGVDGLRLWLPALDGIYLQPLTRAFAEDDAKLETFLACHDPMRAKTYEIEFGTAPASVELYEHVLKEYGVSLEHALRTPARGGSSDGQLLAQQRGCVVTLDDPAATDRMTRFDPDVHVLGVEAARGLLVGVTTDVYMPSGVALPCYDLSSRVQPLFHVLLGFLVANQQLAWARDVLRVVRHELALSTPTQELFLHAMLESCFHEQLPVSCLDDALQLLRPATKQNTATTAEVDDVTRDEDGGQGDMDEYCEIVAHVARKSEPSRLKLLFPRAGDPLELLAVCRQRGELRTAANFLLILEECSEAAAFATSTADDDDAAGHRRRVFRSECAAGLLLQCVEQDEWALARHVVRVARDWEHDLQPQPQSQSPSTSTTERYVDDELSRFAWHALQRGRYEQVVACVEELLARLPTPSSPLVADGTVPTVDLTEERAHAAITERLRDAFVATNKLRELRVLRDAFEQAQHVEWERIAALLLHESEV
ncbi:hypothetical protein PINS_up003274 [Pythium insidiosum]|nr:hypothetical protein PINS_up003274 [Pythium insidiosum]